MTACYGSSLIGSLHIVCHLVAIMLSFPFATTIVGLETASQLYSWEGQPLPLLAIELIFNQLRKPSNTLLFGGCGLRTRPLLTSRRSTPEIGIHLYYRRFAVPQICFLNRTFTFEIRTPLCTGDITKSPKVTLEGFHCITSQQLPHIACPHTLIPPPL